MERRTKVHVAGIIPILCVVFVVSGCFSSRPEDIEVFSRPHEVEVTAPDYILQPPDEVEIRASQIPELDGKRQRIRPDGMISFEGIGQVAAAGKTPGQLADDLREKAAELYTIATNQPVDVQVAAFQSSFYYVMGQVGRPGPKVYTGRDTALRAVAEAGLVAGSWDKRTQVIRPSADPDQRPRVFEINYRQMMVHGDTTQDVLLDEGDIIYVPPTPLASIGMVLEEFLRPIGRAFGTIYTIQRVDGGVL